MGHPHKAVDVFVGTDEVSATNPLPVDATGQGDVPVTMDGEAVSLERKSLSHSVGTVSSSGDNTLVAAPGEGKRFVITAILLQSNSDDDTAVTLTLKSASDDLKKVLCTEAGVGLSETYDPAHVLECGENEAIVLNLSAAESVIHSIDYYEESV